MRVCLFFSSLDCAVAVFVERLTSELLRGIHFVVARETGLFAHQGLSISYIPDTCGRTRAEVHPVGWPELGRLTLWFPSYGRDNPQPYKGFLSHKFLLWELHVGQLHFKVNEMAAASYSNPLRFEDNGLRGFKEVKAKLKKFERSRLRQIRRQGTPA